jgi:hypothetical protein
MTIPSITKNETLGLEAVTIFNEKPYFFLFSDIDSKDTEELLRVLKFYEKWHYSCYYYETTKGFHIISPVLLTFRTWLFRIESLKKKVPEYRFGAIRISKRPTDSSNAYYQHWNDRKFRESSSLHALMNEIFFIKSFKNHIRCNIPIQIKSKKTKLNYIWYDQLNFKSSSIDSSKKAGAICLPTYSVRFQSRDTLCKGKQTFDYDLYNKWRSRMDDPVTYDECIEAQL